jgi:hypothetical protein
MAIVESTTIDGPLRPCVCKNSSLSGVASADDVATKPLSGLSTAIPEDTALSAPAVVPTLASRRMTVGYIGPSVPYLRMQGWWLDRAGFGVGTPVRVEVSEGRLIVEAVEQTEITGCDKPTYLHKAGLECSRPGGMERVPAAEGFRGTRPTARSWYRSIDSAVVNALKELLPAERRRERVSQGALAARSDVSPGRIRVFEQGGSLPSIPVFIALAWSLNLDSGELLDRVLRRMNCPEGVRSTFCSRAASDLPSESVDAN